MVSSILQVKVLRMSCLFPQAVHLGGGRFRFKFRISKWRGQAHTVVLGRLHSTGRWTEGHYLLNKYIGGWDETKWVIQGFRSLNAMSRALEPHWLNYSRQSSRLRKMTPSPSICYDSLRNNHSEASIVKHMCRSGEWDRGHWCHDMPCSLPCSFWQGPRNGDEEDVLWLPVDAGRWPGTWNTWGNLALIIFQQGMVPLLNYQRTFLASLLFIHLALPYMLLFWDILFFLLECAFGEQSWSLAILDTKRNKVN